MVCCYKNAELLVSRVSKVSTGEGQVMISLGERTNGIFIQRVLGRWNLGCSRMGDVKAFILRGARRILVILEILPYFFSAFFSSRGVVSHYGRVLIWGKARRILLSVFPPVARALQRRYGLQGGCISCGASCKLLFQCPHWDDQSKLCTVYADRPNTCRYFPTTPADIRDRNIVLRNRRCGFAFTKVRSK